ncbi:glutamine amidotransferase [Pseudonocardia kujensis]|uniref:type 1 glutamine amidotransferase n=1 Tax=Pseudonocardia kujensis TaxID=1128675 RepID=UPI001E63D8AC|nr:glutamine amidotransferase [Pseudonocardia kujensis]MCE0763024.1 glutamine amidotransferase [Pseudonocardia kujensis]
MSTESAVRIASVSPDLLGTYGDRGNAEVLRQRLRWRGRRAEIVTVTGTVPTGCDIYVLGGGEDSAQVLAAQRAARPPGLRGAVERGAVVLAVCAGLQILGERFAGPDGTDHAGLGLLDVTTTRRARRAVGEVVATPLVPELAGAPLTGFENHGGATRLGRAARPLARVESGVGNGSTQGSGRGTEGVVAGRVVGTYLHGPVLARNPALADLLLEWAVGEPLPPLRVPAVEQLRERRLRARRRRRLIRPAP